MVPLWFTLSALCFVSAGVLLYIDLDRRHNHGRRRRSWARSHGFDYEAESAEIIKRWKRGVMSTVGDVTARNVVLGQIRGEAVYIFDLEDVATVIALHRKVGTNVVMDLRLKGLKEPRENDVWLLGAIGPRVVYSTNLDAARRACDRRMVTFAHTAPDCAEIMWNEENWTLISMPITSTRAEWDEGLRTVRQFNDLLRVLPPVPKAVSPTGARRHGAPGRPGPPPRRAAARPGRNEPPRPGAGPSSAADACRAARSAQLPALAADAASRRPDHRSDFRHWRGLREAIRRRRLRPGAGGARRRAAQRDGRGDARRARHQQRSSGRRSGRRGWSCAGGRPAGQGGARPGQQRRRRRVRGILDRRPCGAAIPARRQRHRRDAADPRGVAADGPGRCGHRHQRGERRGTAIGPWLNVFGVQGVGGVVLRGAGQWAGRHRRERPRAVPGLCPHRVSPARRYRDGFDAGVHVAGPRLWRWWR